MHVIEQPLPPAPEPVAEPNVKACEITDADYILKMNGNMENTGTSCYVLPQDISVGLILNGLTKDFVGFKAHTKSHNAKGKTKVKGKGKDKKDYIPKPKNPKPTAMERPTKDDACHHCKEVGHWKRNCPVYLAELQKKRKQVGSASSSDNCHYAPTITRGVVSVSRLVDNGFVQCFTDYGISVSKNGVLYFNAVSRNDMQHAFSYGSNKEVDKTP
ncbi:zinc finger, CCHC-type containing protein [Tanacetum coccineum]